MRTHKGDKCITDWFNITGLSHVFPIGFGRAHWMGSRESKASESTCHLARAEWYALHHWDPGALLVVLMVGTKFRPKRGTAPNKTKARRSSSTPRGFTAFLSRQQLLSLGYIRPGPVDVPTLQELTIKGPLEL